MLKDPEDLLRRRKLSSFMTTGAAPTPTASTTTTTPPITPPTQHQALHHHHHHQHHLNMMMASALNMSATPTSAPPPLPPILNVPQTAALALTASTASAGSVATSSGHLPAHMAAAAAAAAAAIEQLSQQHQQQQQQQHQQQLQQQQQQQQQQQHLQQQPHQAPMLPINIPQPPQPAAAHHQHHTHPQNSSTTASSRPSSTSVAAANSLMPATSASLVQDHYSLRWNNHQNHILRAFDALLQTKTLVDVTLVSADSSIRAHKMVLSACSPFFQRVFADTPCKHPVIVLKDFPGWVVQAIVDFMYRGEISVQQERLQSLIQAGESLQIRGLVESSVPEHTPTPAASPDDFAMALDSSMLSSELERCSSFDEDSPSMVTAGSKVILPSRLFGASASRRERKRERESISRDLDSDHEMHSDLSTSPMPRRKQARPRRRSSDMPPEMPSKPTTPECRDTHDDQHQDDEASDQPLSLEKEKPQTPPSINEELPLDPEKTVIKREMLDSMDEPESGGDAGNEADPTRGEDSGEGEKSREDPDAKHRKTPNFPREPRCSSARDEEQDHEADDEDADDHDNGQEHDDEELLDSSMQMRRRRSLNDGALSDGPEDLCTTKKDNDTSGVHSMSDSEGSPSNNNNNSKLNNNNRIVLSLKDIRQLNKPSSSSTPNSASSMNPFGAASLRDLRMDRSASAAEQQCKMEALEAQMHAAAAAAACAAANGENPFQHMEHQMDLSLAAAAAAAAVSHQQSRERDHAMQREQREFHQQQQNAYANSLLGQMAGMPGMPGHFGPGGGCGGGPPSGPAPHERLEESMNRLSKDFPPSSPLSLSGHYNPGPDGGPPHPPSPLPFPGMSSALNLTPPHMFGLDSPLGLFPPGIDPGKLYNPLMEMSDPRGMGPDPTPFLKKKMPRPKGQHSAPRGGPPRSWTNAELTEALQHVWNKKMTTSQASRIFGIPYNSLLMYVRGKYGKSLKLEQLRKDCISGPPLELLQMGMSGSSSGKNSNKEGGNSSGGSGGNGGSGSNTNNGEKNGSGSSSSGGSGGNASNPSSEGRESRQKSDHHRGGGSSSADMDLSGPPPLPGMGSLGSSGPRSASSEPDLLGGPNSLFNPFPQGFYPDFASGFPGLPLGMLNLLPPSERHQHAAMAAAMHHMSMDEDCKSVGSKQSSSMDEEFGPNPLMGGGMQPLSLSREDAAVARRASDLLLAGLPQGPPPSGAGAGSSGASGGVGTHD